MNNTKLILFSFFLALALFGCKHIKPAEEGETFGDCIRACNADDVTGFTLPGIAAESDDDDDDDDDDSSGKKACYQACRDKFPAGGG